MKSVLATVILVLAMARPAEAAGLTPGQCADRFPVAAGSTHADVRQDGLVEDQA